MFDTFVLLFVLLKLNARTPARPFWKYFLVFSQHFCWLTLDVVRSEHWERVQGRGPPQERLPGGECQQWLRDRRQDSRVGSSGQGHLPGRSPPCQVTVSSRDSFRLGLLICLYNFRFSYYVRAYSGPSTTWMDFRQTVDWYFQGSIWQHPSRVQQKVRGTHRSRQSGEVPEGLGQGLAGLCLGESQGLGEHQHGLGQELPGTAPRHTVQRPGGETGAGARQDPRLPLRLLHRDGHEVCGREEGGNIQEEEEERQPPTPRLQFLPHLAGQQQERESAQVHQGEVQMKEEQEFEWELWQG